MYDKHEIIKYPVHHIQPLLVEQVHQNIRRKFDDDVYINQLLERRFVVIDDQDFFLNYTDQFWLQDDAIHR